MQIRLATWNINSVRLRVGQVDKFLRDYQPDILCLQETKCMDEQFPLKELQTPGYDHLALCGQKAYHGVAILSRLPLREEQRLVFGGIEEARHLSVLVDGIEVAGQPLRLHNFYVPAGGDVPDPDENPKFRHKLDYLSDMASWFENGGDSGQPQILVGDLNVAPLENDVWSHKQMLKVVSHTPVEVDHMQRLIDAAGWIDVMRDHVPADEKLFTWWSYRARDWQASNRGRRLDHVWATAPLEGRARAMRVVSEARSWERPSDHAPVLVDFDFGP